jgi:alkylhydroperoxidase/carboxymuconolactone decarboxylase family protein YurZ
MLKRLKPLKKLSEIKFVSASVVRFCRRSLKLSTDYWQRFTIYRSETMTIQTHHVSPAFQTFMTEAHAHAQAWAAMCQGLERATALDPKTGELAYLAVLAALRLESGIPFHVEAAKRAGASRAEVISAILVGLPAAGHAVVQVLPAAVTAYEAA